MKSKFLFFCLLINSLKYLFCSNSKLMLTSINYRSGRFLQMNITYKNLDNGVISFDLAFGSQKFLYKQIVRIILTCEIKILVKFILSKAKVSIKVSKTFQDDEYEMNFFETKIDICKAFEGVRGNFIARMFFDALVGKTEKPLK